MRPAVLITGAAKRLGSYVARGFDRAGYHVIVHFGTSAQAAEDLAASLTSAEAVHCDLQDSVASAKMVEMLAKRHTDWPVLVNCAAIFEYDNGDMLNKRIFARAMAVNALTPICIAQSYLHHARAAGGRRVIQFTDQKLENTNPDFFSYSLSKYAAGGAVEMLAKTLAAEDRIYGLAPGAILPSHDQEDSEIERSHILNLLGRKTGAEEIAEAALFLARGHLQSGETLFVDSGQHLLNQDRDVIYLAREQAGSNQE